LIAAEVTDIVVTVGTESAHLLSALHSIPFTVAVNDESESDMAASVRVGLGRADAGSTGILVYPSDHPLVRTETVTQLIRAHEHDASRIIIPLFGVRRGHPTLFPRDRIERLTPGMTLRDLIRDDRSNVLLIPVEDEGTVLDMDTPDDYEKMVMIAAREGE
jgi:CTP:molybdopterin cytidylyltransferase MocA